MKKNVLILPGGYPPLKTYGGPAKSALTIVNNLSSKYNFYVFARNKEYPNKKFEGTLKSTAKIKFLSDFNLNFNLLLYKKFIREKKISTVIIFGIINIHVTLIKILFLKLLNVKIILAPRGELEEVLINKKIFKKFILLFYRYTSIFNKCYFHSTSQSETFQIIRYLNVSKKNIYEIPNLPIKLSSLPKRFKKIKSRLRLVFISRIHPKKGVKRLINIVNQFQLNVSLDIYGIIEDLNYWNECKNGFCKNINYKGSLNYDEVFNVFARYDYFIFLTESENFGHVIFESLQAQTPVIITKNTTPFDSVNNYCGFTIKNDKELFSLINKLISQTQIEHKKLVLNCEKYITKKYNIDELITNYYWMLF